MHSLTQLFQVASGSIIGRDHVNKGTNNQDAHFWRVRDDLVVGVVCDGCGSGHQSEIGAQLGVRAVVDAICGHAWSAMDCDLIEAGERFAAFLEERVRQPLLKRIDGELAHLITDRMEYAKTLEHFFLFTIVGFIITPTYSCVFSLGDGVSCLNGQVNIIPALPGNRPLYAAYGLTNTSLKQSAPELLRFKIQHLLPTHQLDYLLVGTDGVEDLYKQQAKPVPAYPGQYVGGLEQFKADDFFLNADGVRRRLAVLNQTGSRVDWENRKLNRYNGILKDDTTMVIVRRNPVAPKRAGCSICGLTHPEDHACTPALDPGWEIRDGKAVRIEPKYGPGQMVLRHGTTTHTVTSREWHGDEWGYKLDPNPFTDDQSLTRERNLTPAPWTDEQRAALGQALDTIGKTVKEMPTEQVLVGMAKHAGMLETGTPALGHDELMEKVAAIPTVEGREQAVVENLRAKGLL